MHSFPRFGLIGMFRESTLIGEPSSSLRNSTKTREQYLAYLGVLLGIYRRYKKEYTRAMIVP
jgi:hypothetical protein